MAEMRGRGEIMLPEHRIEPRRLLLPDLKGKYSLQIQTTTACNAGCVFCPHPASWGALPAMLMTETIFEKILLEMKRFKFYLIAPYLQSEPLCDPRIFDFLKSIIKTLSFDIIQISTNPLALSKRKAYRLVEALGSTPHEIRISFHGVDRSSYERNMGLNYEQSLKNLVNFLHIAAETNMTATVKALGLKRGAVKCNACDYDENAFLQFWAAVCQKEGLPFDRFNFKYGAYHNRSCNLDQAGEKPKVIVRPDLKGFYCTRVDKWFHILYNGELVLCCNDYFREVVIGDLSQMGISEILDSDRYRSINARVRGQAVSEADFICKRCASPGG